MESLKTKPMSKPKAYSLSIGLLPMERDVDTYKFKTFTGLIAHLEQFLLNKTNDRVYLYQYGEIDNPIIITCNPFQILFFAAKLDAISEHHIHEYSSYEDAYEVAKDLMETHFLRY
jgi:hypothetical protein